MEDTVEQEQGASDQKLMEIIQITCIIFMKQYQMKFYY